MFDELLANLVDDYGYDKLINIGLQAAEYNSQKSLLKDRYHRQNNDGSRSQSQGKLLHNFKEQLIKNQKLDEQLQNLDKFQAQQQNFYVQRLQQLFCSQKKKSIFLKTLLKRKRKDICQKIRQLFSKSLIKTQSSVKPFYLSQSPGERKIGMNQLNQLQKLNFANNINNKGYQCLEQSQRDFQYFLDILSGFETQDYAFLYFHQQRLQYFIGDIIKNWNFLQPIYQPYFERFLDLIKIKIEFISESRVAYGAIYRIQRRLQTALNYKGSRRNLGVDDHITDLLFQHYIQSIQNKQSRNGLYYVRNPDNDRRIPLQDYIADCKQYFEINGGWKDIFSIVTQYVTEREEKKDSNRLKIMAEFVQNIPNITLPTPTCLGCSRFFYVNYNIYQPQVCKHIIALLGSVSQISNNTATIKDEICALLNGKGGVLLFDCVKLNNNVIPRGVSMTEKEKEEIQQKITDYLQGIYPRPQIDKNIFISWVPLVENPFQVKQIPTRGLNYVEGTYVVRIIVKPTFGHIAYFWAQDSKPIFSIRAKSIFPDGKRQVEGRSISRFIKRKFKDFEYEFKDLDPIELKIYSKIVCNISHKCKQPQKGHQLFEKKVQPQSVIANPQQKYKYASVAVAKKSDLPTIKANFIRYNIECYITNPFETLKLKGAAHSAILYHNVRFDQLLSTISNNRDFEFDGRNLLLIFITQFIRLTERNQRNIMPQGDFNSLTVWLHKKYPNETLKMWKFITDNNDQEFYIETGSRESSLYIYIVMTQFLERSAFKNPKGLERMDQRQRKSRFKQVYPSKE